MILVISMKFIDDSTIRVLEWIKRLGGEALHVNGEDIPNMAFGTCPESGSFFIQDSRKVTIPTCHSTKAGLRARTLLFFHAYTVPALQASPGGRPVAEPMSTVIRLIFPPILGSKPISL